VLHVAVRCSRLSDTFSRKHPLCVAVCAVCYRILQCVAVCYSLLQCVLQASGAGSAKTPASFFVSPATHCSTLQHTVQHTASHCATRCATHCITLQQSATCLITCQIYVVCTLHGKNARQRNAMHCNTLTHICLPDQSSLFAAHKYSAQECRSVLLCVAVYCCVLQYVAVCCSMLQYDAMCCSVLQCVAVRCSVLLPDQSSLFAAHCNTLQHAAKCAAICLSTWSVTLLAAHYNTLQHTVIHCNTL